MKETFLIVTGLFEWKMSSCSFDFKPIDPSRIHHSFDGIWKQKLSAAVFPFWLFPSCLVFGNELACKILLNPFRCPGGQLKVFVFLHLDVFIFQHTHLSTGQLEEKTDTQDRKKIQSFVTFQNGLKRGAAEMVSPIPPVTVAKKPKTPKKRKKKDPNEPQKWVRS